MAEKIDERKVQKASSGAVWITIPRAYADDVNLKHGDVVDILREGRNLIIMPKKGGRARGAS